MHYIQLKSGRCAYIRQGQGMPVLLLHGLGSSWQDWQPQIEALSRFAEVFALDLRGHGASEPLREPVSVAELAEDVGEFIRIQNIHGCVLVGISMGGMVGFQLLAQQPELVGRLVAINSAPSFPLDSWVLRGKVLLRLALIRLLGLKAMGRLLARKLFPYAEQSELRRRTAFCTMAPNGICRASATACEAWMVRTSITLTEVRRLMLTMFSSRPHVPLLPLRRAAWDLPAAVTGMAGTGRIVAGTL